jgi:hypothetical protein
MPPDFRSNGKASISENSLGCVTILQWFKRFDATFEPFCGAARLLKKTAHRTGICPKSRAKTNQVIKSLGWVGPLAPHLRGIRLGLVPAWGLT